MLMDELKDISSKCVYENDKFRKEYYDIVKMLKDSAENGQMYVRVKNISPCVLLELEKEGITYKGFEYMGDIFYDLKWV